MLFASTGENGDVNIEDIANAALDAARQAGADDAKLEVGTSKSLTVAVRNGEPTEQSFRRARSLTLDVFVDGRSARASTSDLTADGLLQLAGAAIAIAKVAAKDPCSGLAEASDYATADVDLDIYHPWTPDPAAALDIARRTEAAAFSTSPEVKLSEGASVHSISHESMVATSRGFARAQSGSAHTVRCSPVAVRDGARQSEFWGESRRAWDDLPTPEQIGTLAGHRATRRLGATQIGTQRCAVLFEPLAAIGLMSEWIKAVSGAALVRKESFLSNSLGDQVFSKHLSITEDPFRLRGMRSSLFDLDGLPGSRRNVVDSGRINGCFLSLHEARRLRMAHTGSGNGPYNLNVCSTTTGDHYDFCGLVRLLGRGLIVSGMTGQGVNLLTGDFSRAVNGFWVENGEIQYPVDGITVASNLMDMFSTVVAVGADTLDNGGYATGSWLIESMMIGGV